MNKITECHVYIGAPEYTKTCSTFVMSNAVQMKSCEQLIQSYIADRIVFTVTYS